jgi:hypothetical protein
MLSYYFHLISDMQRDMWRIMPPQLAQRILAIIINDSLAILCNRYAKVSQFILGQTVEQQFRFPFR